jgi:hypothetical protein
LRYATSARLFLAGAVLGAAFLAVSCNNALGVFASIQQEVPSSTTSTFRLASVMDFVADNNNYYARLVTLYARPNNAAAGKDWNVVKIPGFGASKTDYWCTGMAFVNNTFYAALQRETNNTQKGIYYTNGDPTNGATWTQIIGTSSLSVQDLYAVGTDVYALVQVATGPTYSPTYYYYVYYVSTSGVTQTAITGTPATTTTPISSIPTRGVDIGGTHYFAAGTTVYTISSGPYTGIYGTISGEPGAPGAQITALATDDEQNLFEGTSTGYVYRRTPTATYTNSAATASSNTGSTPYSGTYGVYTLAVVPASGGRMVLLVGQQNYYGYYESDVTSGLTNSFHVGDSSSSGSSAIVTTQTQYDTSLQYLPVFAFSYFPNESGGGTLFACASATASYAGYAGLWSDTYSATSSEPNGWSGWTSE